MRDAFAKEAADRAQKGQGADCCHEEGATENSRGGHRRRGEKEQNGGQTWADCDHQAVDAAGTSLATRLSAGVSELSP